jgi:hypothetical protein
MTEVCSLTPLTAGGFAVLGTADAVPAAWVVDSRLEWRRGSVENPTGPEIRASDRTVAPCATATVGTQLLAAGANASEGGTLLWSSADGQSWIFTERLDASAGPPAVDADVVLMLGSQPDSVLESGARRFLLRGTVDGR